MKFIKRLLTFFLSLVLLLSCLPFLAFASSHEAEEAIEAISAVSAQSYLLMDAHTGEILSQNNADVPLPMASTTKIMTCIVALEQCDINEAVLVDSRAVGIEGSSIYLSCGERLSLEELLYGLMLESANDAAVAIALHVAESVEDFASLMNQKAREIGLLNTNFSNPNGLQDENHFSTARDLSVLMSYCMQNPCFAEISSTKTKTISAPGGKSRYLSNHNKLLRTYEPCIAGKTGFTKTAGRCLVTAAEKDGVMLVCTTLGDPDDWRDHSSLFDYGFGLYSRRTVLSAEELKFSVPVVGGKNETVLCHNLEALDLSLRENENTEISIELPAFVYAPISSGDSLGDAVVTLHGKEVARLTLTASENIDQREITLSFWQKVKIVITTWLKEIWKK